MTHRCFSSPTADGAWRQAAAALSSPEARVQASRAGGTRELLAVTLEVTDPRQRWVVSRTPPINPGFAAAEVIWILSGRHDSAFPTFFNRSLPRFAGDGPTFHGAYGHRLRHRFGIDQLARAYDALRHAPDSRQVVLQLWSSDADLPGPDGTPAAADIPCNIVAMLKVREGALHWTQILRSNDLTLGLPYNLVQFTTIQEVLAGWLGLQVGTYTHFADSLHVYERDLQSFSVGDTGGNAESNDDLALPKREFDDAFAEVKHRCEIIVDPRRGHRDVQSAMIWPSGPTGLANLLRMIGAESLRRRDDGNEADSMMAGCGNLLYRALWTRWRTAGVGMSTSSFNGKPLASRR